MLIAVCGQERCARTGRTFPLISHGYDTDTGRVTALPNCRPEDAGARFDPDLGEYVLPDRVPAAA